MTKSFSICSCGGNEKISFTSYDDDDILVLAALLLFQKEYMDSYVSCVQIEYLTQFVFRLYHRKRTLEILRFLISSGRFLS